MVVINSLLTEHDVLSGVGRGGVIFAHNRVDRKVRGLFDRTGGMLLLISRAHDHIKHFSPRLPFGDRVRNETV